MTFNDPREPCSTIKKKMQGRTVVNFIAPKGLKASIWIELFGSVPEKGGGRGLPTLWGGDVRCTS